MASTGSLESQQEIPDTIIVGVDSFSRCGSTGCEAENPAREREDEKNSRRDFLRGDVFHVGDKVAKWPLAPMARRGNWRRRRGTAAVSGCGDIADGMTQKPMPEV